VLTVAVAIYSNDIMPPTSSSILAPLACWPANYVIIRKLC